MRFGPPIGWHDMSRHKGPRQFACENNTVKTLGPSDNPVRVRAIVLLAASANPYRINHPAYRDLLYINTLVRVQPCLYATANSIRPRCRLVLGLCSLYSESRLVSITIRSPGVQIGRGDQAR